VAAFQLPLLIYKSHSTTMQGYRSGCELPHIRKVVAYLARFSSWRR